MWKTLYGQRNVDNIVSNLLDIWDFLILAGYCRQGGASTAGNNRPTVVLIDQRALDEAKTTLKSLESCCCLLISAAGPLDDHGACVQLGVWLARIIASKLPRTGTI